jgi:hypothetical protein
MKPIDRLNLIDRMGRYLQENMTTTDINAYLGGFGIKNDGTTVAASKWVYVKNLLSPAFCFFKLIGIKEPFRRECIYPL